MYINNETLDYCKCDRVNMQNMIQITNPDHAHNSAYRQTANIDVT